MRDDSCNNMDVTGLIGLIFLYWISERADCYPANDQASREKTNRSSDIIQMGENLTHLPRGDFHITSANFAYNSITELSSYTFHANLFRNLEKVQLSHNTITKISVDAFKELRSLDSVDLSGNNISFLEPNTFKQNGKLHKLDLAYNKLNFNPEKAFLRSHSLQTLILSNNQVTHVFDITFARLPNVRTLLLDGNALYYLSPNCFAHLKHLQYVNLANTGVHRLTNSMFRIVPRLVDLTGTDLATKFEPELGKVRTAQMMKLMSIENFILGDDYET